jgi:uncharacterized membrane protein (DUF485 family)
MTDFVNTTLFLTCLALPVLLFLVANSFRLLWITVVRAVFAIICGWAFLFSYAVATNALAFSSPHTQAELAKMSETDGAPLAFAAVLGWVLPAILVLATWGVRTVIAKRKAAGPNNSFKPNPLRSFKTPSGSSGGSA